MEERREVKDGFGGKEWGRGEEGGGEVEDKGE